MHQGLFNVALIYDARLAYDLKVIAGIAAYLQEGAEFSIFIENHALKDQRLPDLNTWDGDGIIADFDDSAVAGAVVRSKLPAVGFGSGYGWYKTDSQIPYFFTNNEAISRLVVTHLLEKGFRHFAYCGYPQSPINGWSYERERTFSESVARNGLDCAVYRGHYRRTRQWSKAQHLLAEWLHTLPKPVGIMAANDARAHQVLEACRAFHLKVPEDVAVVGVDNDESLCLLSAPPLTSIEQGARQIGYKAAELLHQIMRGKRNRQLRFIVNPVGLIGRQSTDTLAVTDPTVLTAMRFIREHARNGIKVPDVADAVAVSRSSLESRLKATLGCTPHVAIRRVQLDQARQLIVNTNLPLKEVASNVSFKSVQHMTTLFRRAFGQPPAEYRKEMNLGVSLGKLSLRR